MNQRATSFAALLAPARLPLVALALLAVLPAGAQQRVTFDPAIWLGYAYTDNVRFLDQGGMAQDSSSTSTALGVTLPVTREFRNGTLGLRYDGSVVRYDEFDALDDDSHSLALDLQRILSRKATLTFNTAYTRSQDRVGFADFNQGFFLGPRLEQDSIDAELAYERQVSESWNWEAGLGGGDYTYEGVAAFDPMAPGVVVENRQIGWVRGGFGHQVSQRTNLGADYMFRRADLDLTGEEDLHRAAFLIDRALGRRVGIKVRIGGFVRSRDAAPLEDERGVDFSVNLGFNEGLVAGPVRFDFVAGIRPDAAGDLGGTSLNTTAGVYLTAARTVPWNWNAGFRYDRRDPFDDQMFPTIEAVSLTAGTERRLAQQLALQINGAWVDQSSDDNRAYEGSYYTSGLQLVWYPLGTKRITGRIAEGEQP